MASKIRVRSLFFFAALVLTGSCIESFQPPTTLTEFNYLIVNGFLIDGEDSTVIKLSRTQTLANKPNEVREFNARVQVEEDNGTIHLLEDRKNGSYAMAPLNLNEQTPYRIKIKTSDGKEYVSDYTPLKTSPSVDDFRWQKEENGVRISLDTHDPKNESRFYFWSYLETWKYNSAGLSGYFYDNGVIKSRASLDEIYYCWKTMPSGKISIYSSKALAQDVVKKYDLLFIPYESRKLYYEYSILVKQHVITEEAYIYWVNTIKNSENAGSIYAPIPSQVIGNIHCVTDPSEQVIGYFSASSITTKRVSIDRQEIPGPSKPYENEGFLGCNDQIVLPNDSRLSYLIIRDKKYDLITGEFIGYSVSPASCLDCRAQGGENVRPPFWN